MAFTAQHPNRAWKGATSLASIKFHYVANSLEAAGAHERDKQRFHDRHSLSSWHNETCADNFRKSQDVRFGLLSRFRFEYVPVDSARRPRFRAAVRLPELVGRQRHSGRARRPAALDDGDCSRCESRRGQRESFRRHPGRFFRRGRTRSLRGSVCWQSHSNSPPSQAHRPRVSQPPDPWPAAGPGSPTGRPCPCSAAVLYAALASSTLTSKFLPISLPARSEPLIQRAAGTKPYFLKIVEAFGPSRNSSNALAAATFLEPAIIATG